MGNRETETEVKKREETLTSVPEERIELPVISANKWCHSGNNKIRLGLLITCFWVECRHALALLSFPERIQGSRFSINYVLVEPLTSWANQQPSSRARFKWKCEPELHGLLISFLLPQAHLQFPEFSRDCLVSVSQKIPAIRAVKNILTHTRKIKKPSEECMKFSLCYKIMILSGVKEFDSCLFWKARYLNSYKYSQYKQSSSERTQKDESNQQQQCRCTKNQKLLFFICFY